MPHSKLEQPGHDINQQAGSTLQQAASQLGAGNATVRELCSTQCRSAQAIWGDIFEQLLWEQDSRAAAVQRRFGRATLTIHHCCFFYDHNTNAFGGVSMLEYIQCFIYFSWAVQTDQTWGKDWNLNTRHLVGLCNICSSRFQFYNKGVNKKMEEEFKQYQ